MPTHTVKRYCSKVRGTVLCPLGSKRWYVTVAAFLFSNLLYLKQRRSNGANVVDTIYTTCSTRVGVCSHVTVPPYMSAGTTGPLKPCCTVHVQKLVQKKLSYAVLYNDDAHFLRLQLQDWAALPKALREQLVFVVLDDGSLNHRAERILLTSQCSQLDILLYRIEKDLAWNIGGARNLVMAVAPTKYVFLTDVDIGIQSGFVDALLSLVQQAEEESFHSHVEVVFRKFARDFQDGTPSRPHPAVSLLSRNAYWMIGGCDEDFVGSYGYTDPHFWYRAQSTVGLRLIDVHESLPAIPALVEFNKSSESVARVRDASRNRRLYERKVAEDQWSLDVIRFTWHKVDVCD